jgi:ribosome-associated protein
MVQKIYIDTEYIKLDSFLKFAGCVLSGGDGKSAVLEGKAKVNGQVCLCRGKKLRDGDSVEFLTEHFVVCRK